MAIKNNIFSADDTVCNESQKSSTIPSRPTIPNQQVQPSLPQPKVHEKAHLNALNGSTPKNALGTLKFMIQFCLCALRFTAFCIHV